MPDASSRRQRPIVVFDAYGTLLAIPRPRRPFALLRAHLAGQGVEVGDFARRAMSARHTLASLAHDYGVDVPCALLARWQGLLVEDVASATAFPEAARVLRHVLSRGATVVIASNLAWEYAAPVRALLDAAARPFAGAPACRAHLALSHDLGQVKPDPGFYRAVDDLLASAGVPASPVFMVGDRLEEDERAPRAHGWTAQRVDRAAGADLWSVPWDSWLAR